MTGTSNAAVPGLRVLFLSPYPRDDMVTGGVEAVAQALVPTLALQPEIEAVQVVSFDLDAHEHEKVVLDSKLTGHYVAAQRRLTLLTGAALSVLRAKQIVRSFDPHIVHAQGIGLYGDVATKLGLPTVVTVHGMVHVEARMHEKHPIIGPARFWLVDRMVHRVLGRAKVVISTSDYDRRTLDELVRNHCISIPNPVRAEFFDHQIEEGSDRVLFAGTMVPRKNVLGIVRAFGQVRAQVPGARLDLVGPPSDAEYVAAVAQLVGKLGLEAETVSHGFVEDCQLLDLMGRCSVLVLFSDEETSPTVIAQAMAMGKPVVASRVGGIPEMVRDGDTGFLVEAGDENALASRLVQLLRLPDICHSMGSRARAIAEQKFNSLAVARQTIDAYRVALK